MKAYGRLLLSTLLALGPCLASAQVPVSAATQHETFLSSPDARLVRNKKLVYDFWREVVDAGQIDQIDKYVAENYIQHNPNVATGRRALAEHGISVAAFQAECKRRGLPTYLRATRGDDIDAACGQLANRQADGSTLVPLRVARRAAAPA